MGLADRAIRQVTGVGIINIAYYIANFGSQIVFARLLTPDIFGTVALGISVVTLLNIFSRWGIAEAISQPIDHTYELSTIFWVRSAYAVLVTGLILASVLALRLIYPPEVILVIGVMAIANLLTLINTPFQAVLQSEFTIIRLSGAKLVSIVMAGIVGIWLIRSGRGLVGLVSFYFLQDFFISLFLLWLTPRYPSLRFDRDTAEWFLQFAMSIFLSKFLNVAQDKGDDYLVGTLANTATLGLYSVAWQLAWAFKTVSQPALDLGMVPAFARVEIDEQDRLAVEFITRMQLNLAIPGYIWGVLIAPELIQLTFGPQWSGAVGIFRVLAIAAVIIPVSTVFRQYYYSKGDTAPVLNAQKYYVIFLITSLIVLVPLFSRIGAAIAVDLTQILGCSLLLRHIRSDIGFDIGLVFGRRLLAGLLPAILGAALRSQSSVSRLGSDPVVIVAYALIVGLSFYISLYIVDSVTVRQDISLLKKAYAS